jgi:predicted O-methyltransferase YrrM
MNAKVAETSRRAQSPYVEWFEGKEFSTDWFTRKIPRWERVLRRFARRRTTVLEVGSYEGRSAVFLLNYLPLSKLVCIDLFRGLFEKRFDQNLAAFEDRVTKIKGSAIQELDILRRANRKFSVIYIDAGKQRDHVLAMSLVAWPLLAPGGVMIWDDFEWGRNRPPSERPHDGIELFLDLHKEDMQLLFKAAQVAVRKKRGDQVVARKRRGGSRRIKPDLPVNSSSEE